MSVHRSMPLKKTPSPTMIGQAFPLRLCVVDRDITWSCMHGTLEATEWFGREELPK